MIKYGALKILTDNYSRKESNVIIFKNKEETNNFIKAKEDTYTPEGLDWYSYYTKVIIVDYDSIIASTKQLIDKFNFLLQNKDLVNYSYLLYEAENLRDYIVEHSGDVFKDLFVGRLYPKLEDEGKLEEYNESIKLVLDKLLKEIGQ